MKTTLSRSTPGFLSLEPKQTISVVMVYEDYATGLRAKRLYDELCRQLEPDCELNQSMWKFEVLGVPRLGTVAAEEAAEADMIIVSMSGENELPKTVADWLETWLGEKVGQSSALVTLFDETEEEENQCETIQWHLRQVARRGGMSFFSNPAGSSDWVREQTPERIRFHGRAASPVCTTSISYDPPSRHWGINE